MLGVPLPLSYLPDHSKQKCQLLLVFFIEMVQMLAVDIQYSDHLVI